MSHKWMSAEELRSSGVLQEANRRFFHPLGLALAVSVDRGGTMRLYGVRDHRDDPEGVIFDFDEDTPEGRAEVARRAQCIDEEIERHRGAREALFGSNVQPLPGVGPDDEGPAL